MNVLHMPARALIIAIAFTAGLAGPPAGAQAPGAQPPDFSKVEIQTTQLASNFYRFEAVGPALVGNAGILTGPDGVLLVDAQFAQLTDKLVAAVKKVSDGRIRFLINTHHHPDHKPLNDLDARVQQAGTTGDRFLGQVYADLKAGK